MKGRVLNTSIMASLTAVVVVLWGMLASVPKTSATPAFSRKYQTSCTTCHNNYPELNDFGEAFKKNGFKFPKDRKSTRLNSSHGYISYAVFCLKKKKTIAQKVIKKPNQTSLPHKFRNSSHSTH